MNDHYSKAEEILKLYNQCWSTLSSDRRLELLAQAQAHATLAGIADPTIPLPVPGNI